MKKYVSEEFHGIIATRTSKRVYTNIVVGQREAGRWVLLGWCGRPDLAEKLARNSKGFTNVTVLPVKEVA